MRNLFAKAVRINSEIWSMYLDAMFSLPSRTKTRKLFEDILEKLDDADEGELHGRNDSGDNR